MKGGGGQKMSIFVNAHGINTIHAGGGGGKKWQNSDHVVVECPLRQRLAAARSRKNFLTCHF